MEELEQVNLLSKTNFFIDKNLVVYLSYSCLRRQMNVQIVIQLWFLQVKHFFIIFKVRLFDSAVI